ncbi:MULTISPECIES: TonB-dependent receptor [unclassified Sphingomonas]|uniref:TonB-dependent receptor n=1 Tax=unclassified Sphingomonas TaxID=196159 RepID=UPI00226AA1AC|nr:MULTISPECIES: TonB-dependent receptor [unclassified Sphingomonas]
MKRARILLSTTMLSFGAVLTTPVAAQIAQPTTTTQSQQPATPSIDKVPDMQTSTAASPGTPVQADASGGQIQDIVVTAERRSASTQKTALTITAISGADLQKAGIVDSRTLTDSIPGLKLTSSNPNAYVGLYGLASGAGNQYSDAIMAFNYGGVPLARQTSASSSYYDLQRVEVLKGPQGTLYGRNATVGAINVIPARPTDTFAGGATLTLGNYATVNTQGFLNTPLAENLNARLAFQTTRHDGYFTNGYDDANNFGARLSVMYEPTSNLSILVMGDGFWNRSKGPYSTFTYYLSSSQRYIDPSNPWFGLGPAGSCANQILCPSYAATSVGGVNSVSNPSGFTNTGPTGYGRYSLVGSDGYDNADQYLLTTEVNWKTPIGTLTVQPSYVHTKIDYLTYSNGLVFTNYTKADQLSLEARLSSNGSGPLHWVLGGFLFHEHQNAFQNTLQSTGYQLNHTPDLVDNNIAGFVDATYSLTPSFRLTGGLRYTHETKSQDGSTTAVGLSATDVTTLQTAGGTCYTGGTPANPTLYQGIYYFPTNFCTFENGGHYRQNNLSFKAGVEFDPRPGSLLYATVKTGFRAGGFTIGTNNTYKPEKLTAYEIGSKNRFFGGKLQANISGFYWDYKDQQISLVQLVYVNNILIGQSGYPANFDGNIYGAEADIQALATPNDRFSADILYAGGKYDTTPPVATLTTTALTPQYNLRRINLPHLAITGGYEHTVHLDSGATVIAGAHTHFESKTPLRIIDPALLTPGDYRGSYAKVDLDLTYRAPGDAWSVQLFVRNVTDKAVVEATSNGQASLPTFFRPVTDPANVRSAVLDPPRTFGAVFSAKF